MLLQEITMQVLKIVFIGYYEMTTGKKQKHKEIFHVFMEYLFAFIKNTFHKFHKTS